MIYVFGSNLAGRHGAGSALYAREHHGAVYGQGIGRQGNAYAIPTKDHALRPLPLEDIAKYIHSFKRHATKHPDLKFKVIKVGCGLAGYTEAEMAPLFADAPENCHLPEGWRNTGEPREHP
jgi:hypothetical protein